MRYECSPGWFIFRADGQLAFSNALQGKRIEITSDDALLNDVYESITSSNAEASEAPELSAVIQELVAAGVLTESGPQETSRSQRFSRQDAFLDSRFGMDKGSGWASANLRASKVVLVGLGGYGTWIAFLLAQVGVGKIIGVDFDIIEESNTTRQLLYRPEHVGRSKVAVCEEQLQDMTSFVGVNQRIRRVDDLLPLIEDADLVINTFGYATTRPDGADTLAALIAKAGIKGQVPVLNFNAFAFGPLTLPGKSPCLFCVVENTFIATMAAEARLQVADMQPSIAPRLASSAAIGTWEAVNFLSSKKRIRLCDEIVLLDLFEYDSKKLPLVRNPICLVCQDEAGEESGETSPP